MKSSRLPVLIIDQHPDVREGLRMLIESEGWTVEAESDPRQAINKLVGGFSPCLILTDLMSPVMNGPDFQRELSNHPSLRDIPIVAYAGLTDMRAKAQRLLGAGAAELPAEVDRLLAAVRQHCSRVPRTGSSEPPSFSA